VVAVGGIQRPNIAGFVKRDELTRRAESGEFSTAAPITVRIRPRGYRRRRGSPLVRVSVEMPSRDARKIIGTGPTRISSPSRRMVGALSGSLLNVVRGTSTIVVLLNWPAALSN